jgi:hypothetical protein
MKFILVILTSFLFTFNVKAVQPTVTKKFQKELAKHFDGESIFTQENKSLSNDNDLFMDIYKGNEKLGLVVLTSAKGRYDKFDYMIVYDLNCKVELIKILVYRSDYGSEITARHWLKQFYTKKEDSLKYGSDIQAISGATFSAISLTKNINRINKVLKEY